MTARGHATISAFVADLAARGVRLWTENGELRFRAPKGVFTQADRDRIAGERAAIIAHLDAGPHPLSFAQERLWFFDQLQPGSAAYNLPFVTRLMGRVDVRAVDAALTAILERHHVLRAVFRAQDGRPMQVIRPPEPWRVRVVDIEGATAEARDSAAMAMVHEEHARPFDLATGPLARATLFRLSDDRSLLAIFVHHIASDGWSLTVMARELTEFYLAHLEHRAPAITPLAMQYPAFAAWQRETFTQQSFAGALDYWRQRLGDAPRTIDLPLDHPRPAAQKFDGASSVRHVDPQVMERVRALARTRNATPFMTMLAAAAVVLSRHSGQADVCIGVPVAGRTQPGTDAMVGIFVDTVVVRAHVDSGLSFAGLVDAVRDATIGAFEHQDVPFEKIVEELLPSRDLSQTPLFQVMFNALNFRDVPSTGFSGIHGEPVQISETMGAFARFDITFYVRDETGGTVMNAVYNTTLFDAPRMEDLLDQVMAVADAATLHQHVPLSSLSLVTPRAARVLPDPSAPLAVEWRKPVADRVRRHAERNPHALVATDARSRLTYRELEEQSNQLANFLMSRGIERGDRVAIVAARGTGLAWAMLGVMKAGAAFLIIDPAYPEERTAACLQMAMPRGCIDVAASGSAAVARYFAAPGMVRTSWPATGIAGEDWTRADVSSPNTVVSADDLAYVVFTSGTTGVPKGIEGTHGPLSHFLEWHTTTSSLDASDRFSVLSGLAHDPLLRDILTPLWVGGSMHFPDAQSFGNPGYLASWLSANAITVVHLTPSIADLISVGSDHVSLPALRRGFFGGDALTRSTVNAMRRMAPNAAWANFYGASETPQAIAWHPIEHGLDDSKPARLPLGKGIADVQLLVLTETGALAGIGELGEIHVRTPYLARGYVGDPATTAAKFVVNPVTGDPADRMYRTGDFGRFRPDGSVEFWGRRDGQIKIRGFRIEAGEVESALRAQPGVREAHACVMLPQGGEEMLVGFVVPSDAKSPPRADDLRVALRGRVPEHMLPSRISVLDELPLTPNGKVDRARLPVPSPRDRGSIVEGRTPMEREIVAIWGDVLGGRAVSATDNFFELGGHSLLATRVLSRLKTRTGLELPLRTLFEAPTVAEFARAIVASHGELADREDVVI